VEAEAEAPMAATEGLAAGGLAAEAPTAAMVACYSKTTVSRISHV